MATSGSPAEKSALAQPRPREARDGARVASAVDVANFVSKVARLPFGERGGAEHAVGAEELKDVLVMLSLNGRGPFGGIDDEAA